MKTLIAASLLLALIIPAHAANAKPRDFSDIRRWEKLNETCTNDVWDDDETTAGGKICAAAWALEKKLTPYQEGMRDYRKGLCYRARPYPKGAENDLWERGYYAQQRKEGVAAVLQQMTRSLKKSAIFPASCKISWRSRDFVFTGALKLANLVNQ